MASTLVTVPKPLFSLLPPKSNAPSLSHSHQTLICKNLNPCFSGFFFVSFPVIISPLRLYISTGFRRNSLKINAVSTKWEPAKVVPQADRVLVRLEVLPEKSSGGVLLPKSAVKFERYLTGEIVSVGSEVGEVAPGKKVLFSDICAYEVDFGTDAKHCFCKESDLLAIVN